MFQALKRIFFLVVFLTFVFPHSSFAANFGIKPAYPREDNARTESIFVHTISPGTSVNEGAKVINSTSETKHVLLYARDSVRSSGGGFACNQLAEGSKNVGSWISFDISSLEEDIETVKPGDFPNTIEISIPAGTEIVIPFTIRVPHDASVGEHNGCILIQEIKEESKETGVSLSLRSGLRVAITVPGDVVRKLEFSDFTVEKKNKSIYLMPSVKNTGNVSIDTDVEVSVRYFFGALYEKFGGQFPVLRDEVYDFNFDLKKPFWGGLYAAKATFAYDSDDGASIGVTSGEKFIKIKSDTVWFFSSPTLLGIISEIGILLVLLFIFAMWRLHKKKQKWIKKWLPYTATKDDTLEKLARLHRVHWEIIAEVNKIKPPYALREGQQLNVPPPRKVQ